MTNEQIRWLESEVSRLKSELQETYGKLVGYQSENQSLKEQLEFVEEDLPQAMMLGDHYVWASQELTRRKAFEKPDICRIIGNLHRNNCALTYSLAACFVEGALYYHQTHTDHEESGDPLKCWYQLRMGTELEAFKRYPMDFKPYPED